MRVLHVSQPTTEGVSRVVHRLVQDQVRRGWEVAVACPPESELATACELSHAAVQAWRAERQPTLQTIGEVWRLRAIVRSVGPEIVHLHSAKAGLAGRLAIRGSVPTVFQPHAWSFHAVRGLERRMAVGWERYAARWAFVVVAVSDDERDEGQHAGVRALFDVIPNGVSAPAAERLASPAQARHRLGLVEGPTAVCVGRLCKQKGQDILLAAWPTIRRAVPAAQLILVGNGPHETQLRQAAQHLGGVTFAGRQEDVDPWIEAGDVFVLPSRWEAGMTLASMEAMVLARPVVLTDVAGSVANVSADVGSVVPVEDVTGLAASLIRYLVSPTESLLAGERARLKAISEYSPESSSEKVAQLYKTALAERGLSRA